MKTPLLPALFIACSLSGCSKSDSGSVDVEYAFPGSAELTFDPPPAPVSKLDFEIAAFLEKNNAQHVLLINNARGRAIDSETERLKGHEALGRPVDPGNVIIIAAARVPDAVVELYTSIERVPNCAHAIKLLYTESADRAEGRLLGYTIDNPENTYTKLVRYDGSMPWLEWITASFVADDAESGRREVLTPAPHTTGHTDP